MRFLLIIKILFCFNFLIAQQTTNNYTSKSIKAIAFFENGLKLFDVGNNDRALIELDKSIAEDTSFVEAYMLIAEIYHQKKIYDKEIENYKKVLRQNPANTSQVLLYLSEAQYLSGLYGEANINIQKCIFGKGLTNAMRKDANFLLEKTKFAIKAVKNPVEINPINLGKNINTSYNDYWPSLTADEMTIYFTSEVPSRSLSSSGVPILQEDIYYSIKDKEGNWTKAIEIGEPINTDRNEGGQSISFDGRFLFFTSCNRKGSAGCDLYYSERIGNSWTAPKNMGAPINTPAWESQPSLSPDGRTLFFVSNRPGGKGGRDIWTSELNDFGTWSKPVNLGDSINTPYDEMSPYIHFDGVTLYFSSNGHLGMGAQDIFFSKKINGKWSKPQNLGYPINTHADEYGMVVNYKGTTAYYSSDCNSNSKIDIIKFKLPELIQPKPVNFVKGIIVDSETQKGISADLELSDLETSVIVTKTKTIDGTGEYLLCLSIDKDYALNISKDGYLFHSSNFSLKDYKLNEPINLNINLQEIKEGKIEILRNIFYDIDSYELEPKSEYELGKLLYFINNNPKIHIEIGGHTDTDGSEEYNKELSENRAKGIYEYLVKKGADTTRISYKGYSFYQPIATNKTSAGRAQNRRTEFKIVKIED